MSALTRGVYATELTDRLGIGVTLNPDGSIAAKTGVEILRTVGDPNGVHSANSGSFALDTSGTAWVNVDGEMEWTELGGGGGGIATGFALTTDTMGTWGDDNDGGTVYSQYNRDANEFRIFASTPTEDEEAGNDGVGFSFEAGGIYFAVAGTGGDGGDFELRSGSTTAAAEGATGGNSGDFVIGSGDAESTGEGATSGHSGQTFIVTGNSSDGNSGDVTLSTGEAPNGRRGLVVVYGLRTAISSSATISSARTLTEVESGGVFSLTQTATNYAITLPSPSQGAGLRFTFVLNTTGSNAITFVVSEADASFLGTITDDAGVGLATGATLTLVGGTAAVGDTIEIISVSPTRYLVRAVSSAAGGITVAA